MTICYYCEREIYTDSFGWGFFYEQEFIRRDWHSECLQMNEGILIA